MSMPRRRRLGLAACLPGVLAGILASAACTKPAAPNPPALVVGSIPKLLDSVHLHLPVQDYQLTDAQNQVVGRARLVLLARCMQRFGFRYPSTADDHPERYGPRSLTDRRYGITDAALAATSGYGLGARDPARQHRPAKPARTPDEETVLFGQGPTHVHGRAVPPGGCLDEAGRELDRQVPAGVDLDIAQKLQLQSFEWTKQNDQVRAAFKAWSGCMAESDYDYTDPLAAAADPRFGGRATPAEIRTALADIDCKARTDLVGVWFTVESAYQRQQISLHVAAFQATAAALAARLRAASPLTPPAR
jgi:hypothetical protein